MVDDLQTAWMSPEQKAQHVGDGQRATADGTVDARDAAYDQMVHDLENQWRPKDAAAAQVKPVGKWTKESGLRVGSPCAFDGQLGTIQEGADGLLYCRTQPETAPRVPSSNPSTDAVPRSMSASDAQKIKDAAWLEMVEEQRNAWRS